jgi:Domain of unknown function (DUF4864)
MTRQSLRTFLRAWTRLACTFMLCCLAPWAASAAPLSDADTRAVRQVVQAQLDAFAAGDAERAFSYASTSIQTQFGDAPTFLAMVRGGYPMVVRPAAVSYFLPEVTEIAKGAPVSVRQDTQLRDDEGRLWRATYLLDRQPSGVWRISGCVVRADSGQSSV